MKDGEAEMVTRAMGPTMKGAMYSLRENGAQIAALGFICASLTFRGSRKNQQLTFNCVSLDFSTTSQLQEQDATELGSFILIL